MYPALIFVKKINGFIGVNVVTLVISDFIWPFLTPYMGVIPNPKMVLIFPISCILVLIFLLFIIYFPKCAGRGIASQNPK